MADVNIRLALQMMKSNPHTARILNELVDALRGLLYLTDQGREGGLILSRFDHKPLSYADQNVIDRAFLAAEAALYLVEGKTS